MCLWCLLSHRSWQAGEMWGDEGRWWWRWVWGGWLDLPGLNGHVWPFWSARLLCQPKQLIYGWMGGGCRPQSLVTKLVQKEGRVQWRVHDGPAFHLLDVSVTVMRPPPLCLLTPSCPPKTRPPSPHNVFCMCSTVWPWSCISQIYGKLDAQLLPAAANIRSRWERLGGSEQG